MELWNKLEGWKSQITVLLAVVVFVCNTLGVIGDDMLAKLLALLGIAWGSAMASKTARVEAKVEKVEQAQAQQRTSDEVMRKQAVLSEKDADMFIDGTRP